MLFSSVGESRTEAQNNKQELVKILGLEQPAIQQDLSNMRWGLREEAGAKSISGTMPFFCPRGSFYF